jgi:hypothetical protein
VFSRLAGERPAEAAVSRTPSAPSRAPPHRSTPERGGRAIALAPGFFIAGAALAVQRLSSRP